MGLEVLCAHAAALWIGVNKLKSQSTRISVYKCYECRKPFMEDSKVPMHLGFRLCI